MSKKFLILAAMSCITFWGCEEDSTTGAIHRSQDAACGNGVVEGTELCDDGNQESGDGCAADCSSKEANYTCPPAGGKCTYNDPGPINSAVCGNGKVETGETCDDGNDTAGDGCSDKCKVESGFNCPTQNQPCVENVGCGDGKIDEGEECDDGNIKGGDGCGFNCKIETGFNCPTPGQPCVANVGCGDGKIDEGETCDDGNTADDDGCSSSCQTEEGYTCKKPGYACIPQTCGNWVVEPGEECDDGDAPVDYDLVNMGLCGSDCKPSHYCGDNKLDQVDRDHGEECDNGGTDTSSEYNGCTDKCKLSFYCGDGQITHGEKCDDGNTANGDGCTSDCLVESGFACRTAGQPCEPLKCGNGALDEGELCDDGNRNNGDGCSQACIPETGYVCPEGKNCRKITCNDGIIEGSESCEDSNTKDGDGCSSICQIEPGWICPDGKDCHVAGCGDGVTAGDEECDDANDDNGDGCTKYCIRESGYACPPRGGSCYKTKCGDGIVEGDETCDEGTNKTAGCDAVSCQITMGWECLTPGSKCTQTAVFGNGKLEGAEECDEGSANKTDGCNGGIISVGWRCPTPGQKCIHGRCGDGQLDKGEFCDDNNNFAGDGCDPVCTKESMFACSSDGSCKPVCGDGITVWEAGEECDDGNTISGDGCSADCKPEEGFQCTKYSKDYPASVLLPAVYRDFRAYNDQVCRNAGNAKVDGCITAAEAQTYGYNFKKNEGHPDFEQVNANAQDMVKSTLGEDGLPVFNAANGTGLTKVSFDMWYRDVPGINMTFKENLELQLIDESTGTYQFSSGSFFPLTGRGYGNYTQAGYNQNFHFTTHIQTYFKYRGNGETLDFTGDDDVWVFVNGVRAIDLGGCHGATNASFKLDGNDVGGKKYNAKYNIYEDGIYPISFFQAERHTGASNFKLTLAGFLDMGPSTCAPVCGDGLVRGDEECDPIAFANPANPTDAEKDRAAKAGCSACKVAPYCGNGKREGYEECDGEDWCQPGCKYDSTCGNGTREGHEQCDEGANNGKEGSSCLINCIKVGCGNNIVDPGEECDDGNDIDDDNCSNSCKRPYCGDGITQAWLGEICDDGINDGSYGGCGLGCSYLPPRCGDAILDSMNGEECDLGEAGNNGSYGACSSTCTLTARCGDNHIDPDFEDCDDGEDNGKPGKCPANCIKQAN